MLSRPWAADHTLREVVSEFLEKPNSVARLINNSQVIRDLYADFRKKVREPVAISKHIRDLAFAPQRYSSESKVLARLVLTWDSVLGVLSSVPDIRGNTSSEGIACLATLHFVTSEKALLLSMLADAALELHRVVRAFDTGDCDESELPFELDRYRQVIRKLFIEGACLHVPGLTRLMLNYLSEQRTFLAGGVRKTLGGDLTADIRHRCLKHMAAYVVVAESVLESEFPEFELISAFRVFSLSDEGRLRKQLESGERRRCLEKLAQAVSVEPETLIYEFEHFLPISMKFARAEGLQNFDAWRKAIKATQKNRMAHSAEALIPVLARLGAWSCSSSAVERGFGKAQAVKQIGQSQDEHVHLEENILILQQDVLQEPLQPAQQRSLIERAKALWLRHCQRVRASGTTKRVQRWDKNLPRTDR